MVKRPTSLISQMRESAGWLGALRSQTAALEKYEKKVADHTAIQTYVAIINTIVSLSTAAVLAYVAFLQYSESKRQVALDYAKVAPQWLVEMKHQYPTGDANTRYTGGWESMPSALTVRLERGEARVISVSVQQDLQVAAIVAGRVSICIARVSNYFTMEPGGVTASLHPLAKVFIADPRQQFGPPTRPYGIRRDSFSIEPEATWVTIVFEDIFGTERSVLLGGRGERLALMPNNKIEDDAVFEVIETSFLSNRTASVPRAFARPKRSPTSANCKLVLVDLQK